MMELEPAEVEDMPLEDLLPSTPVEKPETPDGSVEETPTEPTDETKEPTVK